MERLPQPNYPTTAGETRRVSGTTGIRLRDYHGVSPG
jgi:hypothetical protein